MKQNTKQDVFVPFELESSHGHEATEFSDWLCDAGLPMALNEDDFLCSAFKKNEKLNLLDQI